MVATIRTPKFLTVRQIELGACLNKLRNPLSTHVWFILLAESDFETGEVLTSYARLLDLCSPPRPEKGGRPTGPSQPQMRRAVDNLVSVGLVRRDAVRNEAQGMLRLYVKKRKIDKAF